jgi:alkaline phosphatase
MKRFLALLLVPAVAALAGERRAHSVILFLGDAGGIPTLNAASIYGYDKPRSLFIQGMPHIALSETSPAFEWVTDSAAGMTAIVTGHKTRNGVISESDVAIPGKRDGEPLKTILEYAEERGLSTGVVSNSPMADATPAACYAHVNDRERTGEIFAQVLKPRFGDGVDVVIGPGRKEIVQATRELGIDILPALTARGYALPDSFDGIPRDARRVVLLFEDEDFDLDAAAHRAVDILSRNPRGFFLMVESDLHTDRIVRGLERTVAFDRIIMRSADRMRGSDTLIVYTADHSFDFRVDGGEQGAPLISDTERGFLGDEKDSIRWANVRRDDEHSGEEVLVAAEGPGAEKVHGILANTDLFHIMMAAYGWEASGGRGVR